jgi:hypothetical protein
MIAQTQESLDAAEADLDSLRGQLADYLTATYVDQGIGDAALLLDSGSPDAFVDRLDRLKSPRVSCGAGARSRWAASRSSSSRSPSRPQRPRCSPSSPGSA